MMNLQLFAGSLTVTIYKDAGITTATASKASALSEDEEVTLTITPATGKELDKILTLAGGVTVDPTTKKFTMGESNVTLCVTSKGDNVYKVLENCFTNVNGTRHDYQKNMMLVYNPKTGAVMDVTCEGSAITMDPGVQALIDGGSIVKI